jgi:hypothetical protein
MIVGNEEKQTLGPKGPLNYYPTPIERTSTCCTKCGDVRPDALSPFSRKVSVWAKGSRSVSTMRVSLNWSGGEGGIG